MSESEQKVEVKLGKDILMKKLNKTTFGYKIGIYVRVSTEEQAENPEGSIFFVQSEQKAQSGWSSAGGASHRSRLNRFRPR